MTTTFGCRRSLMFVVLAVCATVTATASAQEAPSAPPIFGGAYGATEQALVLTGQVGGGVSSAAGTVLEPAAGTSDRERSAFTNADVALNYNLAHTWFGFDGRLSSSARQRQADATIESISSGRAGIWFRGETPRTAIGAALQLSRDPVSVLSLLPQLDVGTSSRSIPIDYEIGTDRVALLRQAASLDLRRSLSRRTSFTIAYLGNRGSLGSWGTDRWRNSIRGSLGHSLTRDLAARVGYGFELFSVEHAEGESGAARPIEGHWIDLGIDYNRALSFSLTRQMTLAVTTGSKILVDAGRRRFDVVGSAILNRPIGRTWSSAVGYTRDFGFVDVLARPSSFQSLTTDVGGAVGSRVSLAVDAALTRGSIGLTGERSRYQTYRAGVGLSFSLTRMLGLGVRYSYLHYEFGDEAALETFVEPRLTRQTVRVSLDLSAPLYARLRR